MDCTGVADVSETDSDLRLVVVAVEKERSCPCLSVSILHYLTKLIPVFTTNVMITKSLNQV